MKSLPIPVAQARNNFSDVLADAQNGRRIRLTRHGKPVGWIIGKGERERLVSSPNAKSPQNVGASTGAKSPPSAKTQQSVKTPRSRAKR